MLGCLFHRGGRVDQAEIDVTSRAFTEISALNSLETGQPVSAPLTAASNCLIGLESWHQVEMALGDGKSFATFSSEIVQVVSSFEAIMPASPSAWKAPGEAAAWPRPAAFGVGSYAILEPGRERILCLFQCALSVEMIFSGFQIALPDCRSFTLHGGISILADLWLRVRQL